MTRYAFAFLLILPFVQAQDVPLPPKPKDDGPSLDATMKFIEEKLNSIGPVSLMIYVHDDMNGSDSTSKVSTQISNARAIAKGCAVNYHSTIWQTIKSSGMWTGGST
jgi:hypothetical protein